MKEFQGLAEALKPIEEKSQTEQHAWIQRRSDNRIALLSDEEQQFTDEMAFVKPIATEEKAAKTSKAIDDLLAKRKKRTDQINEQLREQRRATLAQQRQATAGARGARGGRGQMAPSNPGRPPSGGAARLYQHRDEGAGESAGSRSEYASPDSGLAQRETRGQEGPPAGRQ